MVFYGIITCYVIIRAVFVGLLQPDAVFKALGVPTLNAAFPYMASIARSC